MFRINEVLEFNQEKFRILSIFGDELVWISLDDKSAFPVLINIESLIRGIEDETLHRVDDPYVSLMMEMPETGSIAQIKRDKNYALILPVIQCEGYYNPRERSKAIHRVMTANKTTKQTLYRLIRQYWQRGQIINALLPDYKNSGGKGKRRQAGDKKLGRPRKYMPGTGVNIDDFIEKLFRIAIQKYLLNDKGYTFPYAHRRFKDMYQAYFPEIPEAEIPTNWQMKHFYQREYTQAEKIKKRASRNIYNKDHRPLSGTANMQAPGPGSRFEIDATIADIYLVSDTNRRWIVGRPVVYIVVDVFSRLIVGFYVGFENPSYAASILALQTAMTDKVALCQSYGIEIEPNEWPAIGLPDAILADRGELLGSQIESLEKSFSVRIENTPPYRGDAKGIVERNFKTLQADFAPFAPGVVTGTKIKKRGGRDYRLDAKLSVSDFKEIILSSVLYHNQYAVLAKYDRSSDMPVDLPSVPLELWNWGVQHRTGRLRAAPEKALRLSLLPRTQGTVSPLGICAFGLYYTCSEAMNAGWMHRSKAVRRPDKVSIAYDPDVAGEIYLFPDENKPEFWVCRLSERSREFTHCSFWEVWQIQSLRKVKTASSQMLSDKKKRQHEQRVAEKIKQAEKNSPDVSDVSKSSRIAAIRDNRKTELEAEREQRKPEITSRGEEKASVVRLTPSADDNCYYPDYMSELFDEEGDE